MTAVIIMKINKKCTKLCKYLENVPKMAIKVYLADSLPKETSEFPSN